MVKIKNIVLNLILINLIAIVLLGAHYVFTYVVNDHTIPSAFVQGSAEYNNKVFTNPGYSPALEEALTPNSPKITVTKLDTSSKSNVRRSSGRDKEDSDNTVSVPTTPASAKGYNKVSPRVLELFNSGATTKGVQAASANSGKKVRVIVDTTSADVDSSLLSQLSDFDLAIDMKRGFAGYIDINDLAKLDASNLVDYIYEDKPMKIANAESFPLIQADKAASAGYNNFAGLTGKGQTVCIIDSGVDYNHDDLGDCFDVGNCSKVPAGYDFYNNNGDYDDDNGHGTAMAGIIAGNGSGYQGLAPEAKIVALKVTDASGNGWSSLVDEAVQWCLDNATKYNITIISIGLSTVGTTNDPSLCNPSAMAYAIDDAVALGISVFAPTGNSESTTGISNPACITNVTSVSAVSDGSGGGSAVDVIPSTGTDSWGPNRYPGITDLMAPGEYLDTLTLNDLYASNQKGSSFASAHAVGSAMLLREYYEERYNVTLTPDKIRNILKVTGKPIWDAVTSAYYPRIDVLKAVHYEEWAPSVTLDTINDTTVTEGTISLDYTSDDAEHGISNCSLYIDGVKNQTHYYSDIETTCDEQYGIDCLNDWKFDNTFDSCESGQVGYPPLGGTVNEMEINDTYVLPGETVQLTCTFHLENWQNARGGIYYYNGTGWKELYHEYLPQETSEYDISVDITADSNLGQQWLRCSYKMQFNDSSHDITNNCAIADGDLGLITDNDDIYFYVTDDSERAADYSEGSNTFDVSLTAGTYDWNVDCFDSSSVPNKGTSATYSLNVESTWTCNGYDYTNPSVCNGHGNCISQDTCLCTGGWTGIDCSTPPDTTPPVISNVRNVSITKTTAVITWDTDELSNSSVNYGETTSLGTKQELDDSVTTHSISLSGLSAGTTYYYNITSCDILGNCGTNSPHVFTTPDCDIAADCNDGKSCTTDTCNAGTCENTIDLGNCLISGTCYADNDLNGLCQECDSVQSQTVWSNLADDTSCDDGLFCNGNETCQVGICTLGTTPDCSGNDITGVNICSNTPDNNPFTFDFRTAFISTCNEGTDTCNTGSTTVTSTCNVTDCSATCDAVTLCADTNCDITDACVGNDYYDYSDVANSCLGDCSCENNVCGAPTIYPNDARCVACLVNDDCNPLDNDYCSGDDIMHDEGICNVSFECEVQTSVIQDCNTDNSADYCTGTLVEYDDYTCNLALCVVDTVVTVQDCDDNLYCNGAETCSAGSCNSGTTVDCSGNDITGVNICSNTPDNNPFTFDFRTAFTSICNEGTDTCNTGSATVTSTCNVSSCGATCDAVTLCSDSSCLVQYDDSCNGLKLVEYDSDKILDSTIVSDSASNSCLGDCSCENNPVDCSAPATNEYCVAGVCGASCAINSDCDDSNPLTTDNCLANCTCEYIIIGTCLNDSDCDDGLACNGAETCNPSNECEAGTIVDCLGDDLASVNECTYDPDNNPFTLDFFAGFTSVCQEPTGICATGTESITSTCDISSCSAECEINSDCIETDCDTLDACVGNDYHDYDNLTNNCLGNCSCEANTCGAPTILTNDARCITSGPDFDVDMFFTLNTVIDRGTFAVFKWRITNIGDMPSNAITWKIDTGAIAGNITGGIPALQPNQQKFGINYFNYTLPSLYHPKFIADYGNMVMELNEENNNQTTTIQVN